MAPPSAPQDLRAVVAQMYRADWTTLSLSATVSCQTDHELRARMRDVAPDRQGRVWRPGPDDAMREQVAEHPLPVVEMSHRMLLAPGGKYRISPAGDPGRVHEVCDGKWAWVIATGRPWAPAELRAVRRPAGGPGSPFEDLLIPARLLSRYTLELAGRTEVGGRPAHRVLAWPRLAAAGPSQKGPGHVEALVDQELGILLRCEEVFDGQPVKITELADARLAPAEASDPRQFAPPSTLPAGEPRSPFPGAAMPGLRGDAVRTAAGVAATALGFAVRHWPGPAQAGETMPGRPEPLPASQRQPAGDDLVNLLNRTAMPAPAFTAEVHEWADGAMFAEAMARARESVLPPMLDGIFGPDAVWDALADRGRITHQTWRLRLAAPGRYRVDSLAGRRSADPETVACDGSRLWLVMAGRISARPAMPLRRELARLADPAWLLSGYTLSACGETEAGGRRGFLLAGRWAAEDGALGKARAAQDRALAGRSEDLDLGDPGSLWLGPHRVEAVVDAEFGVLLELTCFTGDGPALRFELHDLVPGEPDAQAFEVPPGARSGGPLDGLASPAAAAKAAAGLGVAGAAALVGWLQKRPRTPEPPPS